MSIVNSALCLEELVELLADNGLTANDVMEANFAHLINICHSPNVQVLCAKKSQMLYSLEVAGEDGATLTAEKFLAGLPFQLLDMAEVMVANGGLDLQRAAQNWAVMESVMAAHDPEVKLAIEQRDGLNALVRH